MTDNLNTEKYPLEFINQAYRILRTYRVGPLKSIIPNPDRSQISQISTATTWSGPEGSISLDMGDAATVLWTQISLALTALEQITDPNQFRVFKANRIGIPDPKSDTGDAITLKYQDIAAHEGRGVGTIHRWITKVEDQFEEILQQRRILPPPSERFR